MTLAHYPLISDNQAVADLQIVAYLGIPLITSEGHSLGTFAVIDTVPREWTPDDVTTLGDLAASALTEIELSPRTTSARFWNNAFTYWSRSSATPPPRAHR